MASTGGGAARSGKKRNPDIADPEEASTAELVGTGGTSDTIEQKIDMLVTTVASLANAVNKLVGSAEIKEEKVADKSKISVDKNAERTGKKKRDMVKMHENFIPDVSEIANLAYENSYVNKKVKKNEADIFNS